MQQHPGEHECRWERREATPGCLVVSLSGEVDAGVSEAVEAELLSAFDRATTRLVVDLEGVTFFDSAGIRSLVALRQRAGADGDRVRVVPPPPGGARRTLDLVGIDRLFILAESMDRALPESDAAQNP